MSAVSEESKNKPPDKLVAHPVYRLFWTGSSTLPRLHHSTQTLTATSSRPLPLPESGKVPVPFQGLYTLPEAWSTVTGFVGRGSALSKAAKVAQKLPSLHHVLEFRNVHACQQPVCLVLEIRLLSPIVVFLSVQAPSLFEAVLGPALLGACG